MNFQSVKQHVIKKEGIEYYIALALITCLIGCFGYGLLPALGIDVFKNTVSVSLILSIAIVAMGVLGYWAFLDYSHKKPFVLLLLLAILIPFRLIIMRFLTDHGGNFFILLLPNLVLLPSIVRVSIPYLPLLWQRLPYLRYFVVLLSIVVLYYFFYNHNVYDNNSSQTIGFRSLFAICFNFTVIILTGSIAWQSPDPKKFFNLFNAIIIVMGLIFSILPIALYPMDIMVQFVEGVKRTNFVFDFPAQYSFYIGFITTYLVGLFFYGETLPEKSKLYQSIVLTTAVLGFLALLTAFTKNAIFSVAVSSALIVVLNMIASKQYKKLLTLAFLIPALAVIGIYLLQVTTGIDIMDTISQRVQNASSIDWRHRVWDYLLAATTPVSTFIGHGLSAASDQMRIYEGFNPLKSTNELKQVLYVHNDYIAQFYDFGLPGLIVFFSLFMILIRKGIGVIKTSYSASQNSLNIIIIGLVLSYLIFCSTDNAFISVENPIWMLLTVLFIVNDRIYVREYR